MAKKFINPKNLFSSAEKAPSQETFQAHLQSLLQGHKYRQAIEEIKNIRRSQPNIEFSPSEAEIWLLRGKHEFAQEDFKQAESSLQRSLELGARGEVHYWLAKCLLFQDRADKALDLMRQAFNQNQLSKNYTGCYLKLLLLQGHTSEVEALIQQHPKQFNAAQLHWARGAIALRAGNAKVALVHFAKVKSKVTPGDNPKAWLAYTHQKNENWEAAKSSMGLIDEYARGGTTLTADPTRIFRRLKIWQKAKTGLSLDFELQRDTLGREPKAYRDAVAIAELLYSIDRGDFYDAGYDFLNLASQASRIPELAALRCPLLILAGQQALDAHRPEDVWDFWQAIVHEKPFDPQLVVNAYLLLALPERENVKLLTQLLHWLEQEAKQNSQEWPDLRLKPTLAKVHCLLSDNWIGLNRYQTALRSLKQAERLYPESPDAIGRRGLVAYMEDDYQGAIALLTKALEAGCDFEEVYSVLLESWEELGDEKAYNDVRRRFGRQFGDTNLEAESNLPSWIDALSFGSYAWFKGLVMERREDDPPLQACKIFIEAVVSPPNSGGKVSLQQTEADAGWQKLLARLSPEEQIPTVQAIVLSIHLFAKREKGIAALMQQYASQLFPLTSQYTAAQEAHLVLLAVRQARPESIQINVYNCLQSAPHPGITLARIQLLVRRFAPTQKPIETLAPFIDEMLHREPQNPQLLLAKATTYPPGSKNYKELQQQGFELARRLQDSKALQVFREEQTFLENRESQKFLPKNMDKFADLDEEEVMEEMEDLIDTMLREMIRQQLGKNIPQAEFELLFSKLKQEFMRQGLNFGDFDSMPPSSPSGFQGSRTPPPKRRR